MKTLIETIEKLVDNSEYDKAVEIVKDAFNIEFKAEFLKNDYHFTGDKDKRDIYKITLKRGSRKYSFNFGKSIINSGFYAEYRYKKYHIPYDKINKSDTELKKYIKQNHNYNFGSIKHDKIIRPITPTLYDVLTCLQKYEVGSFEDFCGEFGYDNDSISAKKTYKAVSKEYDKMCSLFTNDELEVLSYIQ